VRSFTRSNLSLLVLILAGFVSLAIPVPAHAGEAGYRLLELDGTKVKWGDKRLGVGASISYAFARENLKFETAINCVDMAPIEVLSAQTLSMETLTRETAAAFRVWESAADLSFHEVADVRDADIILGAQGRPHGRAFASVSYKPESEDGVRAIEQALVCLNPDHQWKVGFDGNEDVYDIRYTLVHEIGHAIGLDHPGPSGQVMGFSYTEAFDDLQPGDLRGVQHLYGPANDYDSGLAINESSESRRANGDDHSLINTSLGLGGSTFQPQQDVHNPEDPASVPCGVSDRATK
jgi:hypothetical protein